MLVRGWIKETTRVHDVVIPQHITSYPLVVIGYIMQTYNKLIQNLTIITIKYFMYCRSEYRIGGKFRWAKLLR